MLVKQNKHDLPFQTVPLTLTEFLPQMFCSDILGVKMVLIHGKVPFQGIHNISLC